MPLTLVLALLLGVVTGLRSVTGIAALSAAAAAGWLDLPGTWLSWLAHPVTAAVLVVLAVGELVADKLSKTPSRTELPGLVPRLVIGGLCGAVLATADDLTAGPLTVSIVAGVVGAGAGCFGGHRIRVGVASRSRSGDIPVALAEDVVAVVGAGLITYLAAIS